MYCASSLEHVFSDVFSIKAGVRQGGVLSPALFAIHINIIIDRLSDSGLGCIINGSYLSCFLYADDMLLISFSATVMQNMLDICTDNITILDLKFNVKKSLFRQIGPRYKVNCAPLILDKKLLVVSSEYKYLGMYITSAVSFRCTFIQSKMKFYRAFNALYSTLCSLW